MLIRLHDRTEGGARPKGLSCDHEGLRFGGDFTLIEASEGPFGRVFRRRPVDQINRLLSAGYGAPIDLAEREPLLDRIADSLTKGDIAHAQLLALQLRLPDLPDEAAADHLARAERLMKFNPNHDELGRFASGPGDGAGSLAQPPRPDIQQAAARALDAAGHSPIQGEFVDPYLNALNCLANGKPVPTGQPTPDLSRYLTPGAQPKPGSAADLFAASQAGVTLDARDNQRAATLDDHLKDTPMAGLGPRLVYWGKVNNIDPGLLVALAGAETSYGAKVTMGANNYWNWLWNRPKSNSFFRTPDDAIQSVAKGLNKNANLESLAFYDKTANLLGPDAWYFCWGGCMATDDLASILRKLGGDPARLGYGATFRPHHSPGEKHR